MIIDSQIFNKPLGPHHPQAGSRQRSINPYRGIREPDLSQTVRESLQGGSDLFRDSLTAS